MTKDDIIKLAREAGFADGLAEILGLQIFDNFANLVADAERNSMLERSRTIIVQAEERGAIAEREACAKLVESRKTRFNGLMDAVRDMEAAAIRRRSNT